MVSDKPGAIQKESKGDIQETWAKRMKAGDAVSESALWGWQAVEMEKRGLIDQETQELYRTEAYKAEVRVYGREKADTLLAAMEARHTAAKEEPKHVAAMHSSGSKG